jgi:hypothetical protein
MSILKNRDEPKRRQTTDFIHLKEFLYAAAERGIPVRIRTPFYTIEKNKISQEDVESIYREMARAGEDYYRSMDKDLKRKNEEA